MDRGRSAQGGDGSPGLDLIFFPLALAAVVFLCGYLPLGLLAVASLDGLNASMHSGLGHEAPLPQRVFERLQTMAWLWLAPLLLLAWLHVGLRTLLRRRSAFGDSLPWDALGSPLVGAAAAALIALAWQASHGARTFDELAVPALAVAGAAFLLLSVSGFALCLLRRYRAVRLAAVAALVLAAGARLGAEVWGRSALARYRTAQAAELMALDTRRAARERPILREPAIDEDAWPRYRSLIDRLRSDKEDSPSLRDLAGLGDLEPFTPIPPKGKAVLESRRAEVTGLREATHCRRCVPEVFSSPTAPVPSLLGLRYLAQLAGFEGNERAQAGDLDGAALRYLEIVRVGGDVGDGNLIHGLIGIAFEDRGLRALGRLVHSGRCSRALLDRSERDLKQLEAQRASLVSGVENERRMLGALGDALDAPAPGKALILPIVVPYRALAADAQRVAEPLSRRFQDALARDDLEAWRQLVRESDAGPGSSWNPFVRLAAGYSGIESGASTYGERLFLTARRQLASFRLAEGAIALEREKLAHGRYPADASALLPRDPFAPQQPLRYGLDGASYRLWSVGLNAVDDGGKSEREADLVL